MRKLLLCDIDGIILPANPDQSLPYMKRLDYLRKLCEEYRKISGLKPIDDNLIPRDNFEMRETTDIGYVMTLLDPDHIPFSHNIEELSKVDQIAKTIIQQSMRYYEEQVAHQIGLKYEANPGIKEFLIQCQINGWVLKISSGNPYALARSKLQLSGLKHLFNEEDRPYLDVFMNYGEEAWYRDTMLELAKNRGHFEKTVYIADRESDIGTVSRVDGIRGIIIPSFPNKKLELPHIQNLVTGNRILILQNLADETSRFKALNFMESNSTGIENKSPRGQRI